MTYLRLIVFFVTFVILPALEASLEAGHLRFPEAWAQGNGNGGGQGNGNGGGQGNGNGGGQGSGNGGGQGNGNGGGRGSGNAGGNSASGAGRSNGSSSHSQPTGPSFGRAPSEATAPSGRSAAQGVVDIQVNGQSVQVRHRHGMIEQLANGRYSMRDRMGRTIVDRKATPTDSARIRAYAR
jgi:hypothetical protein